MGTLAKIIVNWRWAAFGLLTAFLLIAGWTANGWRMDAAKLSDAKAALREAQRKMAHAQRLAVQADEERATMGMKLTEAELALEATTSNAKTIVRRVYVKTDPRCDLESSVVRVLRDVRAGKPVTLPATPDNASDAGGAVTAATGG